MLEMFIEAIHQIDKVVCRNDEDEVKRSYRLDCKVSTS